MADLINSASVTVSYDPSNETASFSNLTAALAQALVNIAGTSQIQVLETLETSSAYPIYNGNTTYFSANSQADIKSNVPIIGTSLSNYCLAISVQDSYICFGLALGSAKNDEGQAAFALSSSAYSDSMNSLILRYNKSYFNPYNYIIPYAARDSSITINIYYIKSEYGVLFKFENSSGYSDYFNLGFVKNENGARDLYILGTSQSYGTTAGNNLSGFAVSFGEEVLDDWGGLNSSSSSSYLEATDAVSANGYSNPYNLITSQHPFARAVNPFSYLFLFHATSFCGFGYYQNQKTYVRMLTSTASASTASASTASTSDRTSAMLLGLAGVPKLKGGQIYLRQNFTPLTAYKNNLYTYYYPSSITPESGTLIALSDGTQYIIITPQILGLAMKYSG